MKIALAAEKQQQSKDGYEAFKKYYKRIRMYLYCTFLCHSILGVLYFRLCFNYLQTPKQFHKSSSPKISVNFALSSLPSKSVEITLPSGQ